MLSLICEIDGVNNGPLWARRIINDFNFDNTCTFEQDDKLHRSHSSVVSTIKQQFNRLSELKELTPFHFTETDKFSRALAVLFYSSWSTAVL